MLPVWYTAPERVNRLSPKQHEVSTIKLSCRKEPAAFERCAALLECRLGFFDGVSAKSSRTQKINNRCSVLNEAKFNIKTFWFELISSPQSFLVCALYWQVCLYADNFIMDAYIFAHKSVWEDSTLCDEVCFTQT